MTKTYLEVSEVSLLEEAATNLRDKLLVRLLFRLGCRVSEALGITVEDIDFVSGTVTIQHLKRHLKLSCKACGASLGRRHAYCPGCGQKAFDSVPSEVEHKRMRTLPLSDDALAILKQYVRTGGPVVQGGKRRVFGINRHRAWQVLKECAERAGLPKLLNPETGRTHNVSPHKLRDAFAVNAMKRDDSGDGLRLLQEHLGHQNFSTTAKYRKVSGEEQREWYGRLWKESKP